MAAFQVVGIDWATNDNDRALARFECDDSWRIVLTEVTQSVTDHAAVNECKNIDNMVVAVDIPFGWPRQFRCFVAGWKPKGSVERVPASKKFRFRRTDLVAKHEAFSKGEPLSVSSNLIGVGARAWIDACRNHSLQTRIDLIGEASTIHPRIIEVYPAATLQALAKHYRDLVIKDYKSDPDVRLHLFDAFRRWFDLNLGDGIQADDIASTGRKSDKLDAVVAGLTALQYRASILKADISNAPKGISEWAIRCPSASEAKLAEEEGWIFFPVLKASQPQS